MTKYIDAEHLRKEVKRLERAAHKSALGCADSETRKFHEGKDFAYQHIGILIDSLQREQDLIVINKKDWEMQEQFRKNKVFGKSLKQEQPEVDLEKELEDYARENPMEDSGSYLNLMNIARHFYELGVNARKEENK